MEALATILQNVLASLNGAGGTPPGSAGSNGGGSPPDLSQLFSQLAGGSGELTESEFVQGRPPNVSESQAEQLFASMDTSGSGSLTEAQFISGMEANAPQNAASGSDTSGNTTSDATTSATSSSTDGTTTAASSTDSTTSTASTTSSDSSEDTATAAAAMVVQDLLGALASYQQTSAAAIQPAATGVWVAA
jgi:hypothetical protein